MVESTKVLLAGETAYKIHTHFKGFASYETGYLAPSLDHFTNRFVNTSVSFHFMPNHDISLRFPFSVQEMQSFDVIVLSDAPADSFLLHPETLGGHIRPNRLAAICDFVRAGGGFAMIGGWMSFGGFHGKAHYAYSPLADFLPVQIDNGDDRMETPEGVHPEALVPDHPILAGLGNDWPDFLGYNRFSATRGETLLRFRETKRSGSRRGDDWEGSGRMFCLRHSAALGFSPFPRMGWVYSILDQSHALARQTNLIRHCARWRAVKRAHNAVSRSDRRKLMDHARTGFGYERTARAKGAA